MSVEAISLVLHHSKATGTTKLVLIGIANHVNPDNDGAWPSQATLAKYANVSDRSVRTAIDKLIELGEVRVEVAGGHSFNQYKPNRYWLMLTCPASCDGSVSHKVRVEDSDIRVEVLGNQGGSMLPTNRNRTVIEPDIVQPKVVQQFSDEFVSWWKVYPRRQQKGDAWKAWQQLAKKQQLPSIEVLLDATSRYAKRVDDPKFVKLPGGWLRAAMWDDEPLTTTTERKRITGYAD